MMPGRPRQDSLEIARADPVLQRSDGWRIAPLWDESSHEVPGFPARQAAHRPLGTAAPWHLSMHVKRQCVTLTPQAICAAVSDLRLVGRGDGAGSLIWLHS